MFCMFHIHTGKSNVMGWLNTARISTRQLTIACIANMVAAFVNNTEGRPKGKCCCCKTITNSTYCVT